MIDWQNLDMEAIRLAMSWVQAVMLLGVGLVVATLLSRLVDRAVQRSWSAQHSLLARRGTFWGLLALFAASALKTVGFDLSVLLGAAGVVTVAIGFASQTSASNVVSGIFLLAERPFAIGDTIRLGQTTGVVLSIDLLSVKLRTFDNLFVRVPNETVMKSEIVNLSRFPIRRFDLILRVAPNQSVDEVREVLLEAVDRSPAALDEPRPTVLFVGYVESGVELQLSAWAVQADFLKLRNTLPTVVDAALREAGLEVGFPRRRVEMIREVER